MATITTTTSDWSLRRGLARTPTWVYALCGTLIAVGLYVLRFMAGWI